MAHHTCSHLHAKVLQHTGRGTRSILSQRDRNSHRQCHSPTILDVRSSGSCGLLATIHQDVLDIALWASTQELVGGTPMPQGVKYIHGDAQSPARLLERVA